MTDAICVSTSDTLLTALPEGYVTCASLLAADQPGTAAASSSDKQESAAAAGSLAPAVGRLVDAQLSAVVVGAGTRAKVRIQLASRTFIASESQQVLATLTAVGEVFSQRQTAACDLDVILFIHNLFPEKRADAAARVATRKFLGSLQAELANLTAVTPRLWLLDGQASDGTAFTIDDIAGVVSHFDPQRLPDSLATQSDGSAFYSFGARMVWFPRTRVLDYLGKRFALRVFEDQTWIDSARLPYVSVAHECTSFIEEGLAPVVAEMALDERHKPLVPQSECPPVSADIPIASSLESIETSVKTLKAKHLGRVQKLFGANAKRAAVELKQELNGFVRRQVDENEEHVVMAQAFLDVLRTSSSALVEGDQIETGKPRTLRQAFADAYGFFDRLTSFDPGVRTQVTELKERLDEQRHSIHVMDREILLVQKRVAAGEDGAAADLQALNTERERVEAELGKAKEQHDEAVATARTQDLKIEHSRDELQRHMTDEIDTEVAARKEAVEKLELDVDAARESLRKAESAFRDAALAIILRVVGLVFGIVLLGFLGLLLLPIIIGAAPVVGAPLFGFIGTVVGVAFMKIWGIGALVAIFGYGVAQARKYIKLKQEIDSLTSQLAARKTALESALREYWEAYRKYFYSLCDWARFSSVFTMNLELEEEAGKLRGHLDTFLEELRASRAVIEQQAREFSLESTRTELVVVDRAYIDALLESSSASVERHADGYFQGENRQLSKYFDAGVDSLVAALGAYCNDEMSDSFGALRGGNIVNVIDETGHDLKKDLAAVPVFLPIMQFTTEPILVIAGPDEHWLKQKVDGVSPTPTVVVSDDGERVLLLRVAYDIDRGDVTVLSGK